MSANQKNGKGKPAEKPEAAATPPEAPEAVAEVEVMSAADRKSLAAFEDTRISANGMMDLLAKVDPAVGVALVNQLPAILNQQRERDAQAVLQDRLRKLQEQAKTVPHNGAVKKDPDKPDGPKNVKYTYPLWSDVRKAVLPMLSDLGLALKPLEIIAIRPLAADEKAPDKGMKNLLLGYATYRLTVCGGGAEMKFDAIYPLSVMLNKYGVPVVDLNLAARACEAGARRRLIMSMAMLVEPDAEDMEQMKDPTAQEKQDASDLFNLTFEAKFGKKFDQKEEKQITNTVMMNIALLFCDCPVPVSRDVVTKNEGKVCLQAFRDIQFRECRDEKSAAEFMARLENPTDKEIQRICPDVENFDEWRQKFDLLTTPCWKV